MKVFISYRREDSIGHAGRLYDSLRGHFGGDGVFMDLTGIDSGRNFVEVIQGAIRSSDVLLAIIGREWLTCAAPAGGRRLDDPADLVRTEITEALVRGTPVIPVLIDGISMPSQASLPEPLKTLAFHDAHNISDERWAYDVGRLIGAIEKLAGTQPRWWQRRSLVTAAAIVALLAILGGGSFWRARQHTGDPQAARDAQARLDDLGSPSSRPAGAAGPAGVAPSARIAGNWSADVKYDWGDKYTETFTFVVDGHEISGTASFLGLERGIVEGSMLGDGIRFEVHTEEVLGAKTSDVVHTYRGTVDGDTISFMMQSRGGSSTRPVEFAATRVSGDKPRPHRQR